MTPQRIQRKRTKGWKMPVNAVYVGRPTKWGNPYKVRALSDGRHAVHYKNDYDDWIYPTKIEATEWAVDLYRFDLFTMQDFNVSELRGKDLVCWCPLDQPCHADILLRLANS